MRSLAGLVLLFSTKAAPERAARLHAAACTMACPDRSRRGVKLIVDDVAQAVADLEERGFPVTFCPCCPP